MLASRLSRQLLSRVSARRLSGEAMQLKVGIVGAGAVGTYFGVRLAELGHDVRFLLNPGEAPPKALTVNSWQGDFELDAPTYASSPGELAAAGEAPTGCSWASSRRLDGDGAGQMARLVGPAVGDGTRVQLLMNGLGAEELAADAFGASKIHGGLVYGGFGRPAPDAVLHEGMATELRGGSFVDDPAEIAAAERLWSPAAGGAAAGRDPTAARPRRSASCEVIRAANADLAHAGAEPRLDEEATVDALCAITDKMAEQDYVPSTTCDFLSGNRMEVEAIFKEPLRRATKLGVDAPRLHMLAALLDIINEKQ
ncbi:PanE/ApbA-like ketopantoate reductase [Aureococcus anophagefferens]|nr:PanE/ApbA-like ketopantoate reductase [Aureococcus anophagefferens]